jgi:hypothetical protein
MDMTLIGPYVNYWRGLELSWSHASILKSIRFYQMIHEETLSYHEFMGKLKEPAVILCLFYGALGSIEEIEGASFDDVLDAVLDGLKNYYPEAEIEFGELDESYPEAKPPARIPADFRSWVLFFKDKGFSLEEILNMTWRGMVAFAKDPEEEVRVEDIFG